MPCSSRNLIKGGSGGQASRSPMRSSRMTAIMHSRYMSAKRSKGPLVSVQFRHKIHHLPLI
jgi:hypothetical protein